MPGDTNIPTLPLLFVGIPKEIMESSIFTAFPVNTFLENITVDENGDLFVTSLDEGAVYKINPTGEKEQYAKTNGKLAGILYISAKSFLLNGWNEEGIPTIWLLNDSKEINVLNQPQGALFLNGMISKDNAYLICDSYKGCIWKYDLGINQSEVWLQHDLLARANDTSSMPAANGIKLHNDTIFVSNTDKQLLVKIPGDAKKAGTPELFLDKVNLDDFVIDDNATIYATTHIYNSVIKITREKKISIIAESDQGLAGSTAAAFGRRKDDNNCIYITTNGGMSFPLPEGLQEGKVVKIKVR